MDGLITEEDRVFLGSFLKLNSFADYSEGIIKGENKAKAMEIILEKTGVGREDSIAIGDSVNDLDMIRYAGLGVAMGNACAELKAAAGAVTGNCGQGGVAQALRKYVL
jgi:hydroxymethylpyrimidine pyrophosphatase-like HAD family hydrolase